MKVYLSSTLNDLAPERQAVKDALAGKCIVSESYTADERSLSESCSADVAGCDLYVGILGLRYGFIPLGETLSITHLEYEQALRGNLKMLVFIKDANAILHMFTDAGTKEHGMELIESFRRHAQIKSRVAVFKTPEDLKSKVLDAYIRLTERTELQGERASACIVIQLCEELQKLNLQFKLRHVRDGKDEEEAGPLLNLPIPFIGDHGTLEATVDYTKRLGFQFKCFVNQGEYDYGKIEQLLTDNQFTHISKDSEFVFFIHPKYEPYKTLYPA
jgi:Domain of unknown function (DUF4062)